MWDPSNSLYVLSGEIISSETDIVQQSSDQMFGLFRNYQKASLGFTIDPNNTPQYQEHMEFGVE